MKTNNPDVNMHLGRALVHLVAAFTILKGQPPHANYEQIEAMPLTGATPPLDRTMNSLNIMMSELNAL